MSDGKKDQTYSEPDKINIWLPSFQKPSEPTTSLPRNTIDTVGMIKNF